MKKIISIIFIIFCITLVANADNDKTFKCDGNVYTISSMKKQKSNSEYINTGFDFVDKKGVKYSIYMSESGSCFIIKTSMRTGKEYKNYLGVDISQDICNKLGKEYKNKKK